MEKEDAEQERNRYDDELRRIQGELDKALDKYSQLYDSAPVGYFTLGEKGTIEEVNLTGAAMIGMERSTLIGKPFTCFVLKDDQDVFHRFRKILLETEISGSSELRLVKKDGNPLDASLECMVIKDNDIRLMWATVSDITMNKRAENALLESEWKFSKAFQTSPYASTITLLENGKLIEINNAFTSITGFSKEEAMTDSSIGLSLWVNEEDRQRVVADLLADRTVAGREYPFRTKIGKIITGLFSAQMFQLKQGYCILSSINDITEHKRLEKEFLRAQKLESVGLLAGGIAHDFNNILTTILGNISMARMQVNPGDDLYDLLKEAETASIRAQALTMQLLTFAKGGAPLKETALIKDILQESCCLALRGSKSKSEFSIAENLWAVEIDVGQISQVIHNIVTNANQAMPEGGTIEVGAENLIIESRDGLPVKPGRYIRLSIKDQVGIAEDCLLRIFDPYFTSKQEGSGLELAAAYSIIKRHDGHITVESQPGIGTTFHIYLPASDKTILEKEEVKLQKGQGRILVMDDEASLRKMVGRMLQKLGYEAELAKDGAEAIEMFKAAGESGKPYDAVILDLTIPGGMGGKEAIIQLIKIYPELKAIVSSGYSEDPVLANFKEYGFKGVIPKPFESGFLSKVLHEVLKGEHK
ncbi:MAG: PAS domain S-box protein [Desulfobacteraceae bacterium]|nr:PAS domain S-box protein [Desulfobacteraceae bacterium]